MYSQPPASALDFAFTRKLYVQPPASAVDFDLALAGSTEGGYSRVPGVIASIGTPWNPEPGIRQLDMMGGFENARQVSIQRSGNSRQASTLPEPQVRGRFSAAEERGRQIAAAWDAVQARERPILAPHTDAPDKDIEGRVAAWETASVQLDPKLASSFLVKTPWKDRTLNERYRSSAVFAALWRRPQNLPAPIAKVTQGLADLDFLAVRTARVEDLYPIGGIVENNPIQPKDPAFIAPHGDAPGRDNAYAIPWGPSGHRDTTLRFEYPPGYVGPVDPWIPGVIREAEEKETYSTVNTVNVKRVSDNTPINMQNLSISLDVDSWAWRLTGTVIGQASLTLIEPGPGGLVDIEVELNGHTWIFMVESYSGSREHANRRFTVQGVSKTQTLAAPYALERSAAYTSAILANQIIDDELLNSGFEVIWDSVISWSIPSDAFSFQDLAPIAIAKRIADAAGSILVPDKSLQELKLKPRFKISPWTIGATALGNLDAQIPMAMVSRLSHQYQPAPLYDSVYVSGTTSGEATLVELNGTGGVLPAPDVYDDLMTDSDVNTERARQVIAGSGARGLYSLTMAVPEFIDAPGLLEPGMMVEVIESPASWRGYVLGTSITAPRSGAEKIEQTVEVVRFYEH